MNKNVYLAVLFLNLVGVVGCSSTNKQPVKQEKAQEVAVEPEKKVEVKKVEKQEEAIDVIGEFNKFAMKNPIYFAFDSDRINAGDFEDLYEEQLKVLDKMPVINLTINGYCDPRGSVEYNNILGKKRALAVSNLVKKMVSNKVQVNIVSFGKNKYKKYSNNVEESYQKNRKVEIIASK